jgi:predicted  nucleic acid-binding Zn-ribbon protein
MELRLDELELARNAAREEVEPRRIELLEEQRRALEEFALLQDRRKAVAARVPDLQIQHYDRFRGGGRPVAVAALTPDGACGNCFGLIPLQIQNEIRKAGSMLACEACGVLLSPGEEEL